MIMLNDLEKLNKELGFDDNEINNQSLYGFTGSAYLGVVVPRDVMVKIAKVLNDSNQKIRQILTENSDKLYAHHWSLIYDQDDKQHTFYYIYEDGFDTNVKERIKYATMNPSIKKLDHLFITENYDTSKTELLEKVANHYGFTSWSDNSGR